MIHYKNLSQNKYDHHFNILIKFYQIIIIHRKLLQKLVLYTYNLHKFFNLLIILII